MNISEIMTIDPENNFDDGFDSPNGSVWIVAVDVTGGVSIMKAPNIHDCFFDNGMVAEYIGLPFEVDNPPGVYEWTCNYVTHRDWESGIDDDSEFEVVNERPLYIIK